MGDEVYLESNGRRLSCGVKQEHGREDGDVAGSRVYTLDLGQGPFLQTGDVSMTAR